MNKWLACCLLLSVGLNIWLLFWPSPDSPASPLVQRSNVSSLNGSNERVAVTSETSIDSNTSANSNEPVDIPTLTEWLAERDPRFFPALTEALHAQPGNWQLLMLEAKWVQQQEPLNEAIIQYFQLLEKGPPTTIATEINATINTLITNAIDKLRQAGDWDTLARFMEPLYQYVPDNRLFILQLAEAYGRQQKLTLMENVLASLPPDDVQANQIRQHSYQQDVAQNAGESAAERPVAENAFRLPVERVGDHFLVPVTLNNRDSRLLIDTGASITTITQGVFDSLRINSRTKQLGKFTVNTAGGQVEADMILLERVVLGEFEMRQVSVLVLPGGTLTGTEGLLGMNILRRFDFHLDQMNEELSLGVIH